MSPCCSSSEALNNGKGIDVCPFEDDFGGEQSGGGGFPFGDDFGGDCGEFLPSGEDWSNIGLTDEDFGAGIDTILQEEAISEGHVDYPSDFPPQTDVFGPGFEWDYANLVQPHFPSSFPGEPLGGHSMSSADDCVRLDTSFDMSALQGTLNPQRLIALRQKLSNICNDQYRGIIEMLQRETSQHQMQYGKLLEQATSDPFLDPNATLAPIGPVDSSYAGSEWTIPRDIRHPGTPSSPGFSRTGRTPPGELRVQGDFSLSSCAPSSQQSSGPTRGTSDLQTSAQFAEFEDDPFNSINNLMLLVRNQQVQNNQID